MATDAPALPAGLTKGKRPPGLIADRGFRILALAAGLMVLVILALIAIYTTREAWPWFSAEGLGIFSDNWDPAHNHFGAGGVIYRPMARAAQGGGCVGAAVRVRVC